MPKRKSKPGRRPAGPTHIEVIARGLLASHGHTLICFNRPLAELPSLPRPGRPLPPRCYGYLPGGHVEPGESAAAALAREFIEEANLPVRVGPLLAVYENQFPAEEPAHHEVLLVFHVEHRATRRAAASSGPPEVRSVEPDICFHWVPDAQLTRLEIRPRPLTKALARVPARATGPIWLSDMPSGPKPGRR